MGENTCRLLTHNHFERTITFKHLLFGYIHVVNLVFTGFHLENISGGGECPPP